MISNRLLTTISLAALAVAAPTVAFAQQAPAAPAVDDAKDIVVTGSRVAGRSQLDSTAPVDVFTAANLQQQGTPQLATAIANIAPSIDFPRPSNTDATDAIRPATLRGMSPDQTLVLINGERAHTSAVVNLNGSVGRGSQAVDLNTIPTVALEGLEVLRDGASALYGSDAIAGVVNLKLRKADHGGGIGVTYGLYDTSYTGIYGKHSVTGEPSVDVSGWQGFKILGDGFLTVSGDYQHTSATNRADNDPRSAASFPGTVDSRTGDPDVFQGSGFANFGKGLGGTWSMYGWAGYQYRNTISNATLRTPGTNSYAQFGITSLYPTGFIPQINTHSKDLNSALGVKGEVDGWSVDAKISYGMNKVDFWTINSANYSYGPTSQTSFYDGALKYDQLVGGVDVAKKFDVLSGLNVAWGAEGRRETYSIEAGEPASYNSGTAFPLAAPGAQGFGGFKTTDAVNAHRSNVSAYIDLDQQVTDKLRLGAAGRFERYSDFGSTETYKVSGRYDFSHAFALRGTISSGFRAPSLGQEYFTSTASVLSSVPITINGVTFPINTPVNTGTYASTSTVGKALGGLPLRPEKSINYSAGGVFRLGGLDLTIDGYYIKVRDALALSENIATSFSPQVANLLNPFGVSQARFFINGVHTTTRGIDAIAHYKWRTAEAGIFDFTLAGNINKITVDSVPTSTSVLNPAPVLFARTRILTISEGTPGEKVTGSLDWAKGKIGATARVTYYGDVVVPQTLAANDFATGPRAITDLELRYQPKETALDLGIGVNNLFDVYPRANPTTVNTTGAGTFPAYTPWGVNGRYLYVRAGLKW
jgi:iron complex outermembrane receptor protein